MDSKSLYMNPAQLDVYNIGAHTTVLVAGRRFGKTHGVVAPWLRRNLEQMPRSSGGIVGATFQQLLTRTLPGTLAAFEDMGYRRDLHYVVGIRPPSSLGFAEPVRRPICYDRVISWYNGSVWYLISQDVPGSSNSLTLQYVLGDEAKFLNFDKLKDETFPANGGFPGQWRDCPWLNSMLFVSDMPVGKKGSWFLNYAEKMDEEVIQGIRVCLTQIAHYSATEQTTYAVRQLLYWRRKLAELRRHAVYYKECSSIENVALLGEKYIRQMKRDLPPLVFLTSILSVRPGKLRDGFYPALSDRHVYTAFNNAYLETLNYDMSKVGNVDCRQDADLERSQPICVAFDYNANINWLVAGQVQGRKLKVLKSFYVKYGRKLRELVDDFCEYYQTAATRQIVLYYDSTGISSNYAVDKNDFVSVIRDQFEQNGWSVCLKYLGSPVKHHEKYLMIDQGLKGQNNLLMPMFNEQNNEALLLALRMAGVRVGPQGFQKDKSGEKHAETEEDKLELRTDGTDAFDTLFLGACTLPYDGVSGVGGVLIY